MTIIKNTIMSDLKYNAKNKMLTYVMKWDDNPFTFLYTNKDELEVLAVKNKLEARLDDYIKGKKNIFQTSDIKNLEYVKNYKWD